MSEDFKQDYFVEVNKADPDYFQNFITDSLGEKYYNQYVEALYYDNIYNNQADELLKASRELYAAFETYLAGVYVETQS